MTSVLRAEALSVRFRIPRGLVSAVTEVSFSLQPGRLLALVGESGCGKSVLAAALLGLLPANADIAGAAWLGDLELTGAPECVLSRTVRGRRVALVPQSAHAALTPTRTIGRQLSETLEALRGKGSVAELAEDGIAVLLITHDLAAARRVADDLAVMYASRLVELGPAAEVLADPWHTPPTSPTTSGATC